MSIYNPNKTQRQCDICRKKIELHQVSSTCHQCFMDEKQKLSLEKRLCDVEWWIKNYQPPLTPIDNMLIGGR